MSEKVVDSLSPKLSKLLHINRTIAGCLDVHEVLQRSLELEKDVVDAETGSILLVDESGEYLEFAVALGDAEFLLKDHRVKIGEGIAGYVADIKEPLLITDASKDKRFNAFFDSKTGFETKSVLCVPIMAGDKLIGVAQVINRQDGSSFTSDDLFLFSAFAGQLAVSIENANLHKVLIDQERAEQEVQAARRVQESYIPREFPSAGHISFGAALKSALQVSGDFYDCFIMPDDRIAAVIGDVSGKGMPAAMYMCRVLTELRAGLQHGGTPDIVLTLMNQRLVDTSTGGMFVTMILFAIDIEKNILTVANAGHTPFFSYQDGKMQMTQKDNNPPLGIAPGKEYTTYDIPLCENAMVLSTTDGITEAMNDKGEMFETKRLQTIVNDTKLPPDLLVQKIQMNIDRFETGEQKDDMTILAFGNPDMDNHFKFEIVSHPSYMGLVRNATTELLKRENASSKLINNINLGISEAVSNVIRHTYNNSQTGIIKIELKLEGRKLLIQIRDFGDEIDIEKCKSRDLDDVRPGGLGIHFIQEFFDTFEYDKKIKDGNLLMLTKDFSDDEGDADES